MILMAISAFQPRPLINQHWTWPKFIAQNNRNIELLDANVTQHTAYDVSYNHRHHQANWVAYELWQQHTIGLAERASKFSPDPFIKPKTALTSDYAKTGYDRGHLAPAGDMKFSVAAMLESFYMSNVSPQTPGFNRGIWKKLEEQVRQWAPNSHPLFVVTGPVLSDTLTQHIGISCRISVPKRFYKVLLDTLKPMRAIAFILPNGSSSESLSHFAISIDALEKITGIDFYPMLDPISEKSLEKAVILNRWNWH